MLLEIVKNATAIEFGEIRQSLDIAWTLSG